MGDSKIPTIIYYDQKGQVRAVGAEAIREGIEEEAEDGKWFKAEWYAFKLVCVEKLFELLVGSSFISAPKPTMGGTSPDISLRFHPKKPS